MQLGYKSNKLASNKKKGASKVIIDFYKRQKALSEGIRIGAKGVKKKLCELDDKHLVAVFNLTNNYNVLNEINRRYHEGISVK